MEQTLRRRQPGETVFGYALLLLGLFVMAEGYRIDGLYSPSSAGVFPALAGLVMTVSALAIIRRIHRMRPAHIPEGSGTAREFVRRTTPADVAVMAALMLAYMLALEPVGFLGASFAFLFLSIFYLHRGGLLTALLVSTGSLAAIWVVFRVLFTVVLPSGWLFR
ncbi:tripartite tricarboxylate transporter TctB family protein [Falsiroseomonas bella]|uniref:Tripartite tricarboxylate transporter TctB family protein n=1 Tax=Falsiroseomonas bella TaxID=2184016 RepID=A0A317FHN4_9PROT|nr:tripartite tricarboxylate transporter TctB family protein [Falsiroseomonas bella]PWS37066.1 tripartite tricarboxylate transporter TctB family protein [Falsiroseomonas bella]